MQRTNKPWIVVALALVTVLSSAGLAAASTPRTDATARSSGALDVVTIWANGTVTPATAPITKSGSTYTLTSDLNGSLVVLASGVTVDGADHLVNYTGAGNGAAVSLLNTSGDTVEQFRSANASVGILANNTTSAAILENPVSGANFSVEVLGSTGTTITGNGAVNSSTAGVGIGIGYCTDVLATDNQGGGDEIGLEVWNSSEVTLDANDANHTHYDGILVLGSDDVVADRDQLDGARAGLVSDFAMYVTQSSGVSASDDNGNGTPDGFYADDSQDVAFVDDNASFSYEGFWFYQVTNGLVSGDTAFESYAAIGTEYGANISILDNSAASAGLAIQVEYVNGVVATGNDAPGSTNEGFGAQYSANVTVDDNDLALAGDIAVDLDESSAVSITGNNLSAFATYGVTDYDSLGPVTVTGNNISNSPSTSDTGIYFSEGNGALTVTDNQVEHVDYGLEAYYTFGPLAVVGNNLSSATAYGVYLEETYGVTTVSGNNMSDSYGGVVTDYQYGGSITVSGNVIDHTEYPVYDYEDDYGYTPFTADNNTAAYSEYGVYVYYALGPVTVDGNDLSHSEYAIYLEDCGSGATLISGNNASDASEYAIYVSDGLGVTVTDNIAVNTTTYAVYLSDDRGQDVVVGNDLERAHGTGVYDYDNGLGGPTIEDNLLGDSSEPLALYDDDLDAVVVGNDLSNSQTVILDDNDLASFAGNNLLNVSQIEVEYNEIGLFYHNDINSTAFVQLDNSLGGSTWNAPYPVGGNYWTGYRGTDQYSGPEQNLAGADGIGDTPYTVDNATDLYPLMTPWIGATITFVESGLPSGSSWTVTFDGVVETAAAGDPVAFAQVNGAYTPYSYSVTDSLKNYTTSAPTGSGTEAGANQVITVPFTALASTVLYALTFNETGLPAGLSWSVTLNGTKLTTTGTSITFHEPNGAYAYTIGLPTGYSANPASGTATVAGKPLTVTIAVTSTAPTSGTTPGTSSGSSLSSPLSEGLLGGLLAALAFALIGWVLYARGRKSGGSGTAPTPWSGAPPASPPTPPTPPSPPPPSA